MAPAAVPPLFPSPTRDSRLSCMSATSSPTAPSRIPNRLALDLGAYYPISRITLYGRSQNFGQQSNLLSVFAGVFSGKNGTANDACATGLNATNRALNVSCGVVARYVTVQSLMPTASVLSICELQARPGPRSAFGAAEGKAPPAVN